jgi:hypothetical protein
VCGWAKADVCEVAVYVQGPGALEHQAIALCCWGTHPSVNHVGLTTTAQGPLHMSLSNWSTRATCLGGGGCSQRQQEQRGVEVAASQSARDASTTEDDHDAKTSEEPI